MPHTTPALDDFNAVFCGLLQLQTIEEFTLCTPRALLASFGGDVENARLVRSWPKLHVLSLYATFRRPLTHAALLPFARSCPGLHTLHLRNGVFLHLTTETLAAITTPAPAAHRLKQLHICGALFDDTSEALGAELISRLFPDARWYPSRQCSHAGFICDVAMAKLVPCGVPRKIQVRTVDLEAFLRRADGAQVGPSGNSIGTCSWNDESSHKTR